MIRRLGILLLAILLVVPNKSKAQASDSEEPEVEYFFPTRKQVTIGVMGLESGGGIPQKQVDIIGDIVAELISKLGEVRVFSKADIISMLNLEKQKRLAGCSDEECFSEIAGALDMPWMVTGNVGILGESIILNLKLIDVRNAYVAGRSTRRIKGDIDDLLDELPEATRELFDRVADRLGLFLSADEVKSASKHRQSIFWSPSAITVFTREDIQNSSAATLTDLLRRVPGFDVYDVKSSYPLVGARALTEDSNNLVLLMVDGREAIVETTGFAFWTGLTIDLAEIERIEVIRGPGSTLYGANAFAAVVNITTVADQPAGGGELILAGGEEGFCSLFSRVRENFDVLSGTLFLGITLGAEEWRSPSDFDDVILRGIRSHGYLRYRQRQELELSLHAGVIDGGELTYIHMGDLRLTDAIHYWLMAKAEFALGEGHRLKAQVYHSNHGSVYKYRTSFRAYDMWIADLPDFPNHTSTVDTQVQLDNQIGESLLLISGANLRYSVLVSENFTPDEIDELRGGVFTHAQWIVHDTLQLTGGLRLDFNTETESALSPRAVAVYRPWPQHAFRLGYGLAFRKPSFLEAGLHVKINRFNPATPEIVEQMATQLGNEGLVNEKVHSVEAGWRAHFLDDRLQASVDLFFNIYRDTIYFLMDVPFRLGLPDIANSTFRYETQGEDILAMGGEAELSGRPHPDWLIWGNLGLRRVSVDEFSGHLASEPVIRANLGGRYLPETGLLLDLAVHYVSEYEMPLRDPRNILDNPRFMPLGDRFLLIGRLGFRMESNGLRLEAGLMVRAPLGEPFREYAGVPFPEFMRSNTNSDFGGELLVRRISFYLRGTL